MKRTFAFPMLFVAISIMSDGSSAVARPFQESNPRNNHELEIAELDDETIADLSKFRIERPVEKLLVNQTEKQSEGQTGLATPKRLTTRADLTKRLIEMPVEALVPGSSPAIAESTPGSTTTDDTGNPKCQPGLVNWHPDFETACAASHKSGRPVMLFQLLGQLDERFT